MSLFVVVSRRKSNGSEFIENTGEPEGYVEYADAKTAADRLNDDPEENASWEYFVGRVVPVEEES